MRSPVLFALAISIAAPVTSVSAAPSWSPFPPPADRGGHSAVFDAARNRMFVQGGIDAQLWMLDLNGTPTWSAPPTTVAPPRLTGVVVLDSSRDRLVAFDAGGGAGTIWTLPLEGPLVWTPVPVSGTAPGASCTALYDPVRDRIVTFGGAAAGGATNDVRALSLGATPAWSLLSNGGPAARYASSAVYDPGLDRMVIFGGYTPQNPADATPTNDRIPAASGALINGTRFNDVWAYSLAGVGSWTQLTAMGTPPSARSSHSAIYDATRARMVIFGGAGPSSPEVWSLALTGTPGWNLLSSTGISNRYAHSAVYDAAHDRMLVFGGYGGVTDGSTSAFDLASDTWSTVVSPVVASARSEAASVFDPVRQRMLVFGGSSSPGTYRSDTWRFDLNGTGGWTAATFGPQPSPRGGATAIYDAARDRMVVFGGYGGSFLADTWTLPLSTLSGWSAMATTGAVPARTGHAAVLDPDGDRMIVFGGVGAGGYTNDVWSLSLATGAWSLVTTAGPAPGARMECAVAYDSARHRMVIFGGQSPGAAPYVYDDVWALSLSGSPEWIPLAPDGDAPSARDQCAGIYDAVGDRMIVFGGEASTTVNEAWALSISPSPHWSQLDPQGLTPLPRMSPAGIYDPAHSRFVLFSGDGVPADTWALDLTTTPVGVPGRGAASAGLDVAVVPNPSLAEAHIAFAVPQRARARVEVLDVRGRIVRVLADGDLAAGPQTMTWDGRDERGARATSGVYFCRVALGADQTICKFVRMR